VASKPAVASEPVVASSPIVASAVPAARSPADLTMSRTDPDTGPSTTLKGTLCRIEDFFTLIAAISMSASAYDALWSATSCTYALRRRSSQCTTGDGAHLLGGLGEVEDRDSFHEVSFGKEVTRTSERTKVRELREVY
jgi:hypothetical protein